MTYQKKLDVLDAGFVQYIDHMGDDASIPQAARVSYAKGTKTLREDEELIHFLMKNEHFSPFAMAQVKMHIKAPLFIFGQLHRHDRFHWNQMSARYSVMPEDIWCPPASEMRGQGTGNKQVGDGVLDEGATEFLANEIAINAADCQMQYNALLNNGLCREQARTALPAGQYTEAFVTANLGDWMLMLRQRMSPHAQKEIRDYAQAMYAILHDLFPVCMDAFSTYQLNQTKLTQEQWAWVQLKLEEEIEFLGADPEARKDSLSIINSKKDRIDLWKKLQ